MDDLDHSVYIAEQDWDSFFEESEECNLQQGALAGLDESGLSDFDEAEFCLSNQEVRVSLELGPLGSHSSIDSTSHFEGLPVEPYESAEGLHGPEDALSAGGSDKHLETVNVYFERTVTSGDDEDPVELDCAGQAREDLSKDSMLLKPTEATEPAGACCAAHEGDIYQETARDCEDAIETEIQTNATLSTESVTDEEEGTHCISNCSEVKFALRSLQASNEREHYRDPSEGEAYSVLKGSQEGMKMETEEPEAEQSSLTRPSASFLDPRKDSQLNTEVQPDANIPARAENINDREKPPNKEKERWFVTVNVGQTHSKETTSPPSKKKRRKKKSCSEDVPKLGSGSEGQDPEFQGNLGAERLGVFEPQIQEIDSNPDHHPSDCIPAAEGSCSSEFVEPTIIEHHNLKNDHGVLMLSSEPLPVFQTTYEFEEYKVNYQESHLDNHQEQHKVSDGSNLQMTVALEGKLTLNHESSQPNCTEVSSWTEPSKPTAVITPHPPNHQNLLVKLLFSTQSDTGCEMLAFCKDSDQDNFPFYPEKRASQEDAEAKNQCKNCLPYSQTDGTSAKCPEHSIFYSESSIPIESSESSNCIQTVHGSHWLHKCLSADQQVALESKTYLSEVPQITEVCKPSGLLVSEINDGSDELDQSKNVITPDKVQNSPKIQKDYTCPDQEEVKKSNNELMHSKETSMPCLYGAERGDAPAKCVTPERDSTLSASHNTQCTEPLTVTKVNSCLLTADQQSIAKSPYLEPSTLYPVDATVSNESSVDLSQNESSIMMFRGSGSHDHKRNKDNHTGDSLCLRSANMSQADYAENLSSQTFPEVQQPPLGPIEGEELDIEETLAEEAPTAGLSAVDSLDCNSKSTVEDLPKEPVTCTRGLESRELDGALDSTRPVYAISSFWDEMEKLTINDILHLRLVCNAQYPRECPHQQDAAATDVSDAADSGYFAHPDESKPDRSTGDGSLFSDFEEEFLQTLSASANPSPEPQDAKSQVLWSPDPTRVWWESAPDPACMGSENDTKQGMALPSEDTISQHLFTDSTQSHKTMCKTVTVQNLQTLEEGSQSSIPLPVTAREEDESSMLFSLQPRAEETCSLASMEHENDVKSAPLPLLSRKASPENSVMSLSEMSEHFFGKDEAETSLTERSSPIFCSLPEMTLSDRSSPIVLSLLETSPSDRSSPVVCSLPEMTMSDRSSPVVCSLPEMTMSDRSSPVVCSLPEMTLSDRSSPVVCSLPEMTLSDRSSPVVCSPPEMTLSDRSSPIVLSLPETTMSDRSSPIVLTLPETTMSDRFSPIVLSLPETTLSDRSSPIVLSLLETSPSDRVSPVVLSLPEMTMSNRSSPVVCSLPEMTLSDRSSPVVCSLPEMTLSDRSSPVVCSLPETTMSDRSSPIVLTLPETTMSDRFSPIVLSLPETTLSDRSSPIVLSLLETSPSDRVSPVVLSLPEMTMSNRSSPVVCSLPEMTLSDRSSPVVLSLPEMTMSDRSSPVVCSLPEMTLSDRSSPIVLSLLETSPSDRVSPVVLSLPEMTLSDRSSPIVLSLPETTLSDRSSPTVLSLPETTMSDRSSPIVLSLPETTMSDRSSPIVLTLPETTMSDRSSPIISLCDRAPNDLLTNFFFPSIQRLSNLKNRGVPIFSCSCSVKRELWFTEEYDCFFPEESPVESEDDAPVHVATRFDNQANEPLHTMLGADTYEHFFTDKDWRGNLFWRNPLSLRRLRFTGGLYSSCDRSISWAFAATGWRESSSLFRTTDPGNTMDDRGTSHPCPNLYLENQLCSELRQQRDTNLQAVVSFPKKGFLFTLKQSDICLVCIAFASWVLKSANPQSEDTWKTVLLANVSAISAIQYLRRYIREDASGNKR